MAQPASAQTAVGVKGSDIYTPEGVNDPRVVLSVKSVRGACERELESWLKRVVDAGHIEDAAVLAFLIRDVRGGRGERKVFNTLFRTLYGLFPELARDLVALVPEYGSWRDLFDIAKELRRAPGSGSTLFDLIIFELVVRQLQKDERAVAEGRLQDVSLLAKWLPREGKKTMLVNEDDKLVQHLAERIYDEDRMAARAVHVNPVASYRKRVAALNRVLQTVETFECTGRWDEIEPKRVPARARELKHAAYLNEFSKHDIRDNLLARGRLRHPNDAKRMACREHFQTFLKDATEGKLTISGANTLFPHELVKKMAETADPTADELNGWNAVWREMVTAARSGGGLGSSIAMCDFSGSMQSAGRTGDTPYWVSMAMGILIASANSGAFGGKFMTFDSTPTWHTLPTPEGTTATLEQAVQSISRSLIGQGTSTDFQKAMDLVLETLKANRVPPGQEPKNLIVITDMGFDAACGSHETNHYTGNTYRHNVKTATWQTHLEMIRENFKRAGEDLWGSTAAGGPGGWTPPRIVIWNVAASNTDDFHAQANTEGVLMLAGWSPSLFKVLCEEGPRVTTPLEGLRAQLDGRRYDAVRSVVKAWKDAAPTFAV